MNSEPANTANATRMHAATAAKTPATETKAPATETKSPVAADAATNTSTTLAPVAAPPADVSAPVATPTPAAPSAPPKEYPLSGNLQAEESVAEATSLINKYADDVKRIENPPPEVVPQKKAAGKPKSTDAAKAKSLDDKASSTRKPRDTKDRNLMNLSSGK